MIASQRRAEAAVCFIVTQIDFQEPSLADRMGRASQEIAERRLDVQGVNRIMLQAIDLL